MKHRILFYAVKELRKRKQATVALFSVMMVCLFITFNFSMMSYGSYVGEVEEQAARYHICIPKLTQTEASSILSLDYIESVRPVKMADGSVRAYITLKNGAPYTLKTQCEQIISDLGLDDKSEYRKNTFHQINGTAHGWINEQYYDLTITPYLLQNMSVMAIFYLFTGVSVCLALRTKNTRCMKEYGYMRTLGLKKREIRTLALVQAFLIFSVSALTALIFSIPLHKLVCIFTDHVYTKTYAGIKFAISWNEILFAVGLLSFIVVLFQIIHVSIILKRDISELTHEAQSYAISFASRSSKQIEQPDKIKTYKWIYTTRRIRTVLGAIVKSVVLFALPVFLLIMSISFNQSRTYHNRWDFVLSCAEGQITATVVDEIYSLSSAEEVHMGQMYDDGTYMSISICSADGMEETCAAQLEQIAMDFSLGFSDNYHMAIMLVAQANFFAPYYLLQSILMFACGLLIVGADLRYELHTRREEFAVIRAVGYPVSALRRLLKSYPRRGILGYGMAAAGMFGFMGFAFQIWPTELMLYPFIVVIGFGVLDFVVHDRICRKCIKQIEEEEISAVLAGE